MVEKPKNHEKLKNGQEIRVARCESPRYTLLVRSLGRILDDMYTIAEERPRGARARWEYMKE